MIDSKRLKTKSDSSNYVFYKMKALTIPISCIILFQLLVKPAWPVPPDVILITIDTLRADYLGSYGGDRNISPVINAIAERGLVFENAITTFPRTTPAIASLMTGLSPHNHGSREVGERVKNINNSLATVLSNEGFFTVGASSNPAAGKKQGLGKGFSLFHSTGCNAAKLNKIIGDLLAKTPNDKPLFLWAHYVDPHFRYAPPGKWGDTRDKAPCHNLRHLPRRYVFANIGNTAKKALPSCKELYAAEIRYTDNQIGQLLKSLSLHRENRTRHILITSDHGEHFGEEGIFYDHGPSLNQAAVAIPLIWAGPGIRRGRDRLIITLEDLMPTILHYAKIPVGSRPRLDGHNQSFRLGIWGEFSNLLIGRRLIQTESASVLQDVYQPGFIFSGRADSKHCFHESPFSLCRTGDKPRYSLYNHQLDPQLAKDISNELPEIVERIKPAFLNWKPQEARQLALQNERFKIVAYPQLAGTYLFSLFDLEKDPFQKMDVQNDHPEMFVFLKSLLTKRIRYNQVSNTAVEPVEPVEPDHESIRILQSLGYIQ